MLKILFGWLFYAEWKMHLELHGVHLMFATNTLVVTRKYTNVVEGPMWLLAAWCRSREWIGICAIAFFGTCGCNLELILKLIIQASTLGTRYYITPM